MSTLHGEALDQLLEDVADQPDRTLVFARAYGITDDTWNDLVEAWDDYTCLHAGFKTVLEVLGDGWRATESDAIDYCRNFYQIAYNYALAEMAAVDRRCAS